MRSTPSTIVLTATDSISGADRTYWNIDCGPWQSQAITSSQPSVTVPIPAPSNESFNGLHTICYYSVDKAGNVEGLRVCMVGVEAVGATPIHVSGTLSANTTWNANQVYVVDGGITVPSGVMLTVLPGAIVKFDGAALDVEGGTLSARGTATQPITFTSYNDNSVGGSPAGSDGKPAPGRLERPRLQSGGSERHPRPRRRALRRRGCGTLRRRRDLRGRRPARWR